MDMRVKVMKSFVHEDQFMEQTLVVEIEAEAAKKYEEEGLVKIIKDKSRTDKDSV